MLFNIPKILTAEEIADAARALEAADWIDGRATAGARTAAAKSNLQLPDNDPTAQRLAATILAALGRNPVFLATALPLKVCAPRFNRHAAGGSYGHHVDAPICGPAGTPVRSDLSATIFLSAPEDYEGGELIIEDDHGGRRVKLPAGHMVLYPATSIHRVQPVTDGARLAAFFWVQSLVREDNRRRLLCDLDIAIKQISQAMPELQPEAAGYGAMVRLASVHANLLRLWADA